MTTCACFVLAYNRDPRPRPVGSLEALEAVLAVLGGILLMRSEATLGLAVREGIGESEGDGKGRGKTWLR